ncbi:MAG: SIS domain-containing protein [Leptolyngbyaceae cyanobacterium bins.302]|nr:SIS domain-containing protein [Leptolyngbyaceae cyanobacterium bins.302]
MCETNQDFPHFMLKEIHQQPAAIQTCLSTYWNPQSQTIQLPPFPFSSFPHEIHILASGTSRHASLIAQFWLEQLAHIPTRVRSGSEFLEAPLPLTANTLTIGVTQSGETADTLQALEFEHHRRNQAAPEFHPHLLGITNQATSSLADRVDTVIPTLAGTEVGVAATKTFTTQLVVFYLLALKLAEQRQCLNHDRTLQAIAVLHQLPAKIQQVLQQADRIQAIAEQLVNTRHCIVLGRGINQAIALEAALKLKETTYLHAEGYAAGEFMHGPIALLDEQIPIIAIAPADNTQANLLANIHKAKSHGSPIIGIVTRDDGTNTAELFETQIILPTVEEMLSPLLTVIPLQLLAYHIAVLRGLNVDRPRNITKTLA